MTKILSKKDLKLLKGYFEENIYQTIEDHKNTSPDVLRLLIKKPKSSLDFLSPYLIAIIILVPTILVSIMASEYLMENYIMKYPLLTTLFCGFALGVIVGWLYVIKDFKEDILEEEDRWLVYEFMIALKKENKIAKDVRKFLEEKGELDQNKS